MFFLYEMSTEGSQTNHPVISRSEAKLSGLSHYFTGKLCKNGHIAKRHTACGRCIICRNEWNKDWQRKNPEKTQESRRKTRNKDIEAARERTIRWRLANPDRAKEYREENRARDRAYRADYLQKNKEKVAAYKKLYCQLNRDKRRMYQHKRRAIQQSQTEHYSTEQIEALFEKQKHHCANCGKSIKDAYHIDHITPLSLGGSNGILNIQLLCPTCNLKKHAKDPIDWARENGRLL